MVLKWRSLIISRREFSVVICFIWLVKNLALRINETRMKMTENRLVDLKLLGKNNITQVRTWQ